MEVEIADFVKGQALMAASFPVVISSDQSTLSVDGSAVTQPISAVTLPLPTNAAQDVSITDMSAKLPSTLGQKANSGSLSTCRSTTAGAYDLSGRTTIATAGTSTKLLCDNSGVLAISNLRAPITDVQTAVAVGSGGTFTSNTIDMDGFSKLTIMGSSTNANDQLKVQFSVDDSTYYQDATMITPNFSSGDYASVIDTGGARYVQIIQIDTQTTAFTMDFSSSKR